jgi:hypothetical protein
MIKLNLLPEKVRAGERLQLILILGALFYALGIVLLGWRWAVAKHRVSVAAEEVAAVQAQLDAPELREAVQAVDRFTKDEKEKIDKASVVNALRKKQVALIRLLDALPDWMMDGQVWVTSLAVTPGTGERKVSIEGKAVSPLAFAHFYTNLETQPIVKKLSLDAAPSNSQLAGRPVVSFKVSFVLEEMQ